MAVAKSISAALAPSTKNQYAGAAHIFLMFCMYIEGDNFALPASDSLLCLYLQWQSLTVDPKNLKTKLSAIRYLHERLGYVWTPPSERFMVHRCIMGLKRLCLTPVKRKLPITPALLMRMRMCPTIDWSTPTMVVMWGAMRRHLCCGDVVLTTQLHQTWPACLGLSPRPLQPCHDPSPDGERAAHVG